MRYIALSVALAFIGTSAWAQRVTLPFVSARSNPAKQASQPTDAAAYQWLPDTIAMVDQLRAKNCLTSTVDRIGTGYRGQDALTDDISTSLGSVESQLSKSARNSDKDSAAAAQASLSLNRVVQANNPSFHDIQIAVNALCYAPIIAGNLKKWKQNGLTTKREAWHQGPLPAIIENMAPTLACYADDAALQTFLKQVPLEQSPYDRSSLQVPEAMQSKVNGITDETATSLVPGCRTWAQTVYFRPFFSREEARIHSIEELRALWVSTGLKPDDMAIWENSNPESKTESTKVQLTDPEEFFNELNLAVEHPVEPLHAQLTFQVPPKGEFEKTADYETRVTAARNLFAADAHLRAMSNQTQVSNARYAALNEFLGSPTISESSYDADAEKLKLTVISRSGPLRIHAVFAIPPREAQDIKPLLETTAPHVLFGLPQGEFAVRAIGLWIKDKVYPGTVVDFTKSPIVFGPDAAEKWPKILAARIEAQHERRALQRQAEAEQIRAEARNNPRLAFALEKAQSGDPRCAGIWSNAVAIARQPNISDSVLGHPDLVWVKVDHLSIKAWATYT
jgi:hypothetical protein